MNSLVGSLLARRLRHCLQQQKFSLQRAVATAAPAKNSNQLHFDNGNLPATRTRIKSFVLERLKGRSLVRVHGEQSREFLQGLITNDINKLPAGDGGSGSSSMFTMFLNKAGRVLFDAIIYKPIPNEETYIIECDRQVEQELQNHLKIFRVRKKIDIDLISNDFSVWVAFNRDVMRNNGSAATLNMNEFKYDILISTDPRIDLLGTRIIAPSDRTSKNVLDTQITEGAEDEHRLHRYRLGVGEGCAELPVGKCFPLENNCDYLKGISFNKGCYLGQEFTARTQHTGVVRKRLLPIHFIQGQLTPNSSRSVESSHGSILGKVKGFHFDSGIALLKYEAALKEEAALVFGGANDGEVTGRPMRPKWWPPVTAANRTKIN